MPVFPNITTDLVLVATRRAAMLRVAALSAAAAGLPAFAQQEFPTRPITIIVPFPPGSATDNVMRPLAYEVQKLLGQSVVIDNRPGAQGILGTQIGAHAKPDGYTLIAGSSTTLAASVGLFKSLPYEPLKDFQPVAGVGSTMQIYIVRADFPANDLAGFVAQAKKQSAPFAAGYGSSSAQVAIAMLEQSTGAKFSAVPYKGTQQAMTDLIGGVVPMVVVDVGGALPHLKNGTLKALAVTGATRSTSAPNVPALVETYPGAELKTWIALVAPAGTPAPIVAKLHGAIDQALATPSLREKFTTVATEIDMQTPESQAQRMRADAKRWLELIRLAGIKPE